MRLFLSASVVALSLGACASVAPTLAPTAAAMPDRIHPPEQDVEWVRGYAAADGFTYSPWLESLAALQEFHYRAMRVGLPGYVAIWGDDPRLMIDMKPPYDRAALMALLAPELRDRVTIREVRYNLAESEVLFAEVQRALEAIGNPESMADFSRQNDRLEVTLTSKTDADRLRAAMSPNLAEATSITIASSPLIVF